MVAGDGIGEEDEAAGHIGEGLAPTSAEREGGGGVLVCNKNYKRKIFTTYAKLNKK